MKTLQIIAVAWYKADQWAALKCASVDDIEETYLEWLFNAEKAIKKIEKNGMRVEKVIVDVPEMLRWCSENKKAFDGAARAMYVTEKFSKSASTGASGT